eukprot:m.63777 g.63777  ORF g.63777 m.63777 type:complete len:1027 (+) comp7215_c0_seq3:64-3144(+)
MPVKVPFRVIYCSGSDDEHDASALETHAPTVKGWQTAKYCFWPQEIILRLERVTRVRKVQILSHQYKIATRIELFYANPQAGQPVPQTEAYARLGHISLSDNVANDFKTRELKSVHIDSLALLLRLVIHKNHVNSHNLYNQVGIIAINVIGDPIDEPSAVPAVPAAVASRASIGAIPAPLAGEKSLPTAGFMDRMATKGRSGDLGAQHSAIDDLIKQYLPAARANQLDAATLGLVNAPRVAAQDDVTFDLSLDPETAQLVRQLQEQKAAAVAGEDYGKASLLKTAIEALVQAGEEMGKLTRFKQRAVEDEDFDTAVQIKEQMTLLRAKLYASIGVKLENGVAVLASRRPSTPMLQPMPGQQPQGVLPKTPPLPSIQRQPQPSQRPPSPPLPTAPAPAEPKHKEEKPKEEPVKAPAKKAAPPKEPSAVAADPPTDEAPPPRDGNRSPPIRSRFTQGLPPDELPGKMEDPQDRPLPVHRKPVKNAKAEKAESPIKSPGPAGGGGGGTGDAEPLSDKAKEEAAIAIEVFGEGVVANVYAKAWALKVQGLDDASAQLKGPAKKKHAGMVLQAIGQLLHMTLKDKLKQVQQKSFDLARQAFEAFKDSALGRSDVAAVTDAVLPSLLAACGDMAVRVRETARSTVKQLHLVPSVREFHMVPAAVFARLPAKAAPREAQGRLDLLASLASELDLEETLSQYMGVVAPCLMHANKDVRTSGVEAVVAAYKIVGTEVMELLRLSENDPQGSQMLKAVREAVAAAPAPPPKKGAKGTGKAKPPASPPVGRKAVSPAPDGAASPAATRKGNQAGASPAAAKKPVAKGKVPVASPIASPPISPPVSPSPARKGIPVPKGGLKSPAATSPAVSRSPSPTPRGAGNGATVVVKKKADPAVKVKVVEDDEKTCIFCGKHDDSFDQAKMDMHFWKSCPMLKQCAHCKQVVEISMLREHWSTECAAKDKMKPCPKCKEPKLAADLAEHQKRGACRAPVKGKARCPVCLVDLDARDEAWKTHLMGGGCKPPEDKSKLPKPGAKK